MTSLITLPIRLSLEITVRAAKLGVDALRVVTRLIERDGDEERPPWPAEEDWPIATEATEAVVVPEPPAPPAPPEPVEPFAAPEPVEPFAAPIDFDAPSAEELAPRHIDSEAELSYEAGPAEDVGATVHVDAPWEGYDRMRAADIVARLRSADAATRAVVRLYEQQGKARSSVLAATG